MKILGVRMVLGLGSWFHNFSQFTPAALTPEVLADVPTPYTEIAIYGLFKAGEVGSVIGGIVAHPIYRWYLTKNLKVEETTPNSHKIIRSACRRLQGRILLSSLVIGPSIALLWAVTGGRTRSDVANTCYAIRRKDSELTIDRCSLACGLIGWYWRRFQGAVDGVNVGLTWALFNNKILAPSTSPVLINKIKADDQYGSVEEAANRRSRLEYFMASGEQKK